MRRVGFEYPQLVVADGFEDDAGDPQQNAGQRDGQPAPRRGTDDRRQLQRQRDEPGREGLQQKNLADNLAHCGSTQQVGVTAWTTSSAPTEAPETTAKSTITTRPH